MFISVAGFVANPIGLFAFQHPSQTSGFMCMRCAQSFEIKANLALWMSLGVLRLPSLRQDNTPNSALYKFLCCIQSYDTDSSMPTFMCLLLYSHKPQLGTMTIGNCTLEYQNFCFSVIVGFVLFNQLYPIQCVLLCEYYVSRLTVWKEGSVLCMSVAFVLLYITLMVLHVCGLCTLRWYLQLVCHSHC